MSAPVRITLFNHRDGVGKTMLTANIAFALAEMGKSVLLVDSDPQSNLTSYLVADRVVAELLSKSDGLDGRTIWSALKPVSDGDRAGRPVAPMQVGHVALLPGDIKLAGFAESLNECWAGCLRRRLDALYATSSISTLISALDAQYGYDFVFFDSGFNIGPLNRVLLLDSDYFIVPVACDLLSVRALATLGQAIERWMQDADTIGAIAPDDMPLLAARPTLLGHIAQRFRVYGRATAKGDSFYLREIKSRVNDDIASVLRQQDERLAPSRCKDPVLGEVKDLAPIVQVSQREGVALWECSGGTPAERNEAKRTFARIANCLVEAVQQDTRRVAATE